MSDLNDFQGKESVEKSNRRLVAELLPFGARLSRRSLLGRGAALGVGASVAATMLAACGGSSNKTTPTTAPASTATSASTSASSGGSTATSAATTAATSASTQASSGGDYELASDQTLRLPTAEPYTMDPEVTSGDGIAVMFNIYDGLVGVNQDTGKVEPHMADKYEANTDASEYTFSVKSGLKWSDGTAINANDFIYSWKRVLDPETKSAVHSGSLCDQGCAGCGRKWRLRSTTSASRRSTTTPSK